MNTLPIYILILSSSCAKQYRYTSSSINVSQSSRVKLPPHRVFAVADSLFASLITLYVVRHSFHHMSMAAHAENSLSLGPFTFVGGAVL